MTVSVLFFGHYSDYFGGEPLSVTLPEGATVCDLAQTLAERDPRLSNLAAHCRFAVAEEYASLDQPLQDNDTVAVLPPMSGG
jgi:molybdopterin synthase sulfur carrier subunit